MGIATVVMVGLSAWIVLALPVGLLIGAMVRSGRRAPQRPGPSTTTRTALTDAVPSPVTPADQILPASTRRNRLAELAQV